MQNGIFLKTKGKKVFKKCARHMAVHADALWQCRLTKPILGKFSYYFTFLIMSIASLAETHGLLQQTQDNLVVWSEAYQEENPGHTIIKIPQIHCSSCLKV